MSWITLNSSALFFCVSSAIGAERSKRIVLPRFRPVDLWAVSTYAALRVAFAVRAIEDFIHIHVLKYLRQLGQILYAHTPRCLQNGRQMYVTDRSILCCS